jgi:hypothetical protein
LALPIVPPRISSSARGYSRNRQSNNPGAAANGAVRSRFLRRSSSMKRLPTNVTAVGSLSEGATIVQPADQEQRRALRSPRGAGVNTYTGRVRAPARSRRGTSARQKALGTG